MTEPAEEPVQLSAELQEVLARPNPSVMATVRRDGMPVSVATWYLWDGGRVLFTLDAARKRLDDLRADPRVSLTVLDGADWYRHVSLRGRVVAIEDDAGLAGSDRISRHYRGRPYPDRERPRVIATMAVEEVHSWPG